MNLSLCERANLIATQCELLSNLELAQYYCNLVDGVNSGRHELDFCCSVVASVIAKRFCERWL